MKIGILSDAHGNLIALEKCLDYLDKISVDKIYFLGDAIGYYPKSIDVLSRLIKDNVHCLLGNHEAMLLGRLNCNVENEKIYKLEKVREEMPFYLINYLENLTPDFEFNVSGKNIKLMHGGPSNFLTEYVYPNTELDKFNKLPHDFCFMGHTHIPFVKAYKNKTIVNVGSCGMPRDYGTLSSIAVIDTNNWGIDILRIEMNTLRIKELYSGLTHKSVFDLHERKVNHFTGILIKE